MSISHEFLRRFTSIVRFVLSLGLIIAIQNLQTKAMPVCSVSGIVPGWFHDLPLFDAFSITTGDFNGDGRGDIAVGSSGFVGIAVFINDGSGNFAAPTIYNSGGGQTDITTGDFNNDDNLDIAAVNQDTPGRVVVMLGDGHGLFGIPITSPSGGPSSKYLAPGDFNSDGILDLAVSNGPLSGGGNITILIGDGAGSFTVGSTATPQTQFMRAADFNRDGKMDVLAVTAGAAFRLYLGNGIGGLSTPTTIAGDQALDFTITDFNGDGSPDVAAMVNTAGSIFNVGVFLGLGDGSLAAPQIYTVGGHSGSFIESGDIDGDAVLDLVVTKGGAPGRVFVLLGTGRGTFGAAIPYQLPWQRNPFRLAVADFNGDRRADIVTQNLSAPDVSVMLSICLTPSPRFDFDGDGGSDVSVFRPSSGTWYGLRSSDNSYFAQSWGLASDRIVAADYDGDSKTDLAVYRQSTGSWYVLRSSNNTVLSQQWGIDTDIPVAADFDGDGQADFAVYRAGAWYVLRSSDGIVDSQFFGIATDRPVPADYDKDGKADLAVYRPEQGVWYIKQSSDGLLRTQAFGTTGDLPVAADYDGDGKADLAVYRPSIGTWYAQRSSNNTLLAQAWGLPMDVPVPADYDGDGRWDAAVYRPLSGTWHIMRSSNNQPMTQVFGTAMDIPIPAR